MEISHILKSLDTHSTEHSKHIIYGQERKHIHHEMLKMCRCLYNISNSLAIKHVQYNGGRFDDGAALECRRGIVHATRARVYRVVRYFFCFCL